MRTDQLFCRGCGHLYICVWAEKKVETLPFGVCVKVKVSILEDEIVNTLVLLIYSDDSNSIIFDTICCCS